MKVRLEGIDAPEKSQAFGAKAKDALTEIVAGKVVTVHKTGADRYERTLARVYVGSDEVNSLMVAMGFAGHYKQYSQDETLAELDERAKVKRSDCGKIRGRSRHGSSDGRTRRSNAHLTPDLARSALVSVHPETAIATPEEVDNDRCKRIFNPWLNKFHPA